MSRRFEELDALRGIAAIWVVLYHYTSRYDAMYADVPRFPFSFPNGELAVYLFFMVSGFVILMTLRVSHEIWDFVVSRGSRLYPAYWAGVIITFTAGVLWPLPGQRYTLAQLAVNATMLQDYFYVQPLDGVYWSLTYELGFYAVMCVVFLRRWLNQLVPIGALWLALAFTHHLTSQFWDVGVPYRLSVLLVLKYAHLFIAGMMFYEIWHGHKSAARLALLAACAAMAIVVHGLTRGVVVLSFFAVFFASISGRLNWIRVRPLLWLGLISYPLYLTHELLGFRLIYALEASGIPAAASVAITLALVLMLAATISRLVERPAMRSIRTYYRNRALSRGAR